ncbi:site-specific integrase [Gracilimonas sediminicola]|uniref:Site-specific integrase n=1 Tax=Gracilimonas sediminicola TaxID=2952158 RepID=A0A9X2RB44_9BACT|nr:site-specific integrase [Gracilimonas sediminicola]MCP9290051.1 site-specific integrase [Gracilimonas sediminicola]
MASVSSFNDSLWRASISDKRRHKNAKQIYYPKDSFSKRQAKQSATALEHRHKDGEDDFDLWKVDVQVLNDKVTIRHVDGTQQMNVRELFDRWIETKKSELAERSITNYEQTAAPFLDEFGSLNIGSINTTTINNYVNQGKLNYRLNKKKLLSQLFDFGSEMYGIKPIKIEVESTKAERSEIKNKSFKDFLIEYECLQLASSFPDVITRRGKYPAEMYGYFFLLLFYFPRRIDDFIHLKPEWIEGKVVYIGDDDYLPKSQEIELTMPTEEALRLLNTVVDKYGKPGKQVFPFTYIGAYQVFKKVVKKLFPDRLVKLSPHKLRDSGIMYHLHELDMQPQELMSITGHANFASLEKYVHRSAKALIHQRKTDFNVKSMLQLKNKFMQGEF